VSPMKTDPFGEPNDERDRYISSSGPTGTSTASSIIHGSLKRALSSSTKHRLQTTVHFWDHDIAIELNQVHLSFSINFMSIWNPTRRLFGYEEIKPPKLPCKPDHVPQAQCIRPGCLHLSTPTLPRKRSSLIQYLIFIVLS